MAKSHKILLVGQGLAGTVLAKKLLDANINLHIVDKGHTGTSSALAAGLVNPVTGRRIVKSWLIDDLLPVARKFYDSVSAGQDLPLWIDLPVLRLFTDAGMSNNWGHRMMTEGYEDYLDFAQANETNAYPVHAPYGAGIIHRAARVLIGDMITAFRQKWKKAGLLEEAEVTSGELKIEPGKILYKNQQFEQVIFCEGEAARNNPLFAEMPFQVSKGEVLFLRVPGMPRRHMVKKKITFVPAGEDLFWVGATNFWNFEDGLPSGEGRAWLLEEIQNTLKCDFEIVDHRAAIRPTVRHRRPLIGFPASIPANAGRPTVGIFNGFGTKGTSLVPYWADRFVEFLLQGKALSEAVNVQTL